MCLIVQLDFRTNMQQKQYLLHKSMVKGLVGPLAAPQEKQLCCHLSCDYVQSLESTMQS